MAQTMNFDEALDLILWWHRREESADTLVSLGLVVRILFGKCKEGGEELWSAWSGGDWSWPIRFLCPDHGNHWITSERYEDWPFGT